MAVPDVRIRLSAEGDAAVLAALRRIREEALRTANRGSGAFTGLNSVFASTQRVLGALGIAIGAASIVNLVREGSQLAESMQLAGVRIGTTTERASALALVARENEVDFGRFEAAVGRANVKLAEARQGSVEAAEPFRDLKIPLTDLAKLDTAERLERIARAFAAFPEGPERSAVAIKLFGRSGAALIPVLLAIANEGLEGVIRRGREFGVIIGDELARKTDRLNDRLTQFNLRLKVLGATFAGGLSGELVAAIDALDRELARAGPERIERYAQTVGRAIRFVVELHLLAIDTIKDTTETSLDTAVTFLRQLKALVRGDLDKAKQVGEDLGARVDARIAAFQTRAERLARLLTAPAPEVLFKRDRRGPKDDVDDVERASRDRLAAERSALDAELQFLKLRNKVRSDADKRSFDESRIELSEFFRRRRVAILAASVEEATILRERRRLAETEEDPEKRKRALQDVANDERKLLLERAAALADVAADERKAARQLGEERAAIDRETAEAQGRRHEAALREIDEQVARREEALRKAGAPPEERATAIAALRESLTAAAEFERRVGELDAALRDLDVDRASIEARVAKGLLTQREGESEILRLERDRTVALREIAASALEAAAATGDPEAIARVREMLAAIDGLRTASSVAAEQVAHLRDRLDQAVESDIADFLSEGIDQAESFGDAMRGLALSVVESIRRIAAEILASRITEFFFSLAGGGAKKHSGGPVEKRHSGGSIWSPRAAGDVHIIAQEGEHLVRREVARHPRVRSFLDRLNAEGVSALRPVTVSVLAPRMHAGGPVGAAPPTPTAGISVDGEVRVGLAPGLVPLEILTPAGRRSIIRVVSEERRTIGRLVG